MASNQTCVAALPQQVFDVLADGRSYGYWVVGSQEIRGSRVVMTEGAAGPLTALVFNPLTHLLVRARSVESLRRLHDVVEGRGPSMSEAAAP